jgi:glyoxylase-like metal-dependent hydrolase (beta-lactamase superfamily II)
MGEGITRLTEPAVHELLRCNVWHVAGRDHDMIVDTGLGVSSLRAAAEDLFSSPVIAVATHAHMDHVGNFAEFDERLIHRAEADAVAHAADDLPLDVGLYDEPSLQALAKWGYDISGGLMLEMPHPDFDLAGHELIGVEPTCLLDDGDVVDLGDRAYEVVHVPGHSPGSIGLWDPQRQMLFSGDAVYDGPLLDELPGSDADIYVESMRRLRDLPVEVVHGGHGESMGRSRYHAIIDSYLIGRGA